VGFGLLFSYAINLTACVFQSRKRIQMPNNNQNIYTNFNKAVRATFGTNQAKAALYYKDFVKWNAENSQLASDVTLLDVGCGNGWSTYCLAASGFHSVGVDLNPDAFEAPVSQNFSLQFASATALPFPDSHFDIITCYQCLEHVPNPELALDEMRRVCKQSGLIIIVGPNLLNPFLGLRYLIKPKNWKSIKHIRTPSMPMHTAGNTFTEIMYLSVVRFLQTMQKLVAWWPIFSMRKPDTNPPFYSDNDACYLCSPIDLIRYFTKYSFNVIRKAKQGRLSLFYFLRGGTWVAVKKPPKPDHSPNLIAPI